MKKYNFDNVNDMSVKWEKVLEENTCQRTEFDEIELLTEQCKYESCCVFIGKCPLYSLDI